MGCKVDYKMTAEGKKFMKTLSELGKRAVYVGFNEESGSYDDGVSIAEIATFNEFGTSTIPARPFLHDTIEQHQSEALQAFQDAGKQIMAGAEPATVYNRIGLMAKGLVQQQIVDGSYVPNAPATIKKKGSDKPLIDTGRMRQSVTYVVR